MREYYAYDPHEPPFISKNGERLRSWHLVNGVMVPQPTNAHGHIWSPELDAWLVPDGPFLRLHDRKGQRWLTEAEARDQETQAATKQARATARLANAERAAKEAEARRAEAERAAKEAERAAKEAAWAKLRELGIDPTTLN